MESASHGLLGRFDSRFHGLSIHVSSRAQFDFLRSLLLAPRDGPITVEQAMAVVTATNTDVVYATTFAHELRHYYDFQISPWGARVQAERIDAILRLRDFTLSSALSVRRADGSATFALPVPLVEWCRARESVRLAFIEEVNQIPSVSEAGGIHIPDLPRIHPLGSYMTAYLSAKDARREDLSLTALRICKCYQSLQQVIHYNPPPEGSGFIQPAHVAEASAILVQAWEMFNLTADRRLGEHLETLSDPSGSRLTRIARSGFRVRGGWLAGLARRVTAARVGS